MEAIAIILATTLISGYLLFRLFTGDFTIENTEVIKSEKVVNTTGQMVGYFYHIKTTYKSGRIKITEKEL
jgi:hypothetical protein